MRERRLALGIGQGELARRVGISASYLNLIEHNRRPVKEALLARLGTVLGLEPGLLALDAAAGGLAQDLRAAAVGAPEVKPEVEKLDAFLGRFPGWAEVLALQFRRIDHLERMVAVLNDRINHDPHLSQALHEVLSAVSLVRSTAAILAETEDIEPEWRARFHGDLYADSERLALGAEALVAYLDGSEEEADTGAAPQEELESWLAAHGWHFAALEAGKAEAVMGEVAGLASAAARGLAWDWVVQAAADARALPLAEFEAALLETDDPILLARRFGCDVLRVFRRIAFRPGAVEGLVLCDGAGALLMRKPVVGFSLPRHGAACPLWPLYTALSRPAQPVTALAEMPGLPGHRFVLRAYCALDYPAGFSGPQVRDGAMLIAPCKAAPALGPVSGSVLAIGSSCRICPRGGCAARREASIIAELA